MEMSKDCEDFGIDFPHAPPACPAGFDKELEARGRQLQEELLHETKRYNELKEIEIMEGQGRRSRSSPAQESLPYRSVPEKPVPSRRGVVSVDPTNTR